MKLVRCTNPRCEWNDQVRDVGALRSATYPDGEHRCSCGSFVQPVEFATGGVVHFSLPLAEGTQVSIPCRITGVTETGFTVRRCAEPGVDHDFCRDVSCEAHGAGGI